MDEVSKECLFLSVSLIFQYLFRLFLSGRFVFVLNPKNESTLTSKLTGPTQGATDCLEFAYLLNGLHTKLTVYIQPEGRPEMLIWSFTSNTNTDTPKWQLASVPVQQCVAFQV
ncbi:hypothetical protein BaRGS_00033143 [Batillaria attramentaria]|uniref:MAM domain-containing protein n=1 Tax=Batillaria attramentaria TaxID=370345 RepID=A0ABD0JKS9_9CAEN